MYKKIGAICGLWLFAVSGFAHDLQANRATLVLRDGNHLSLTFFINYTDALHQALAPQQTFAEFVLPYSAMTPPVFEKELLRAQGKFQAGTRVVLAKDQAASVTHWVWPEAAQVQKLLQQRAMQILVAPAAHPHETPLEIRAEVTAPSRAALAVLKLRLPTEFQQVLVVSYQPKQVWLTPRTLSPEIRF